MPRPHVGEDHPFMGRLAFSTRNALNLRDLLVIDTTSGALYIHNKTLFRKRTEREPSRFELFFDLIFVAILQQLSHGATETFSGASVGVFIVLFFPSWVVWHDLRLFINRSGTDDIPQRLYILLIMGLPMGCIVNASALAHDAVTSAEHHEEEPTFPTLRPMILFFLVARAIALVQKLIHAYALPKFRIFQLGYAFGIVMHIAIYFPLIWVHSQPAIWILMAMGIVVHLLLRLSAGIGLLAVRMGWTSVVDLSHAPALNIEHHIERESQFIIVVLGEAILNLTYSALPPRVGITPHFGRSILGLMAAYLLCWLYFEQDVSHTFVHALRRHWLSAVASIYMHFPLAAGLILWSATLHELVEETVVAKGPQWYLAGGLSVALLCLALAGWLHKNLDAKGSSWIPRNVLITMRIVAAIVCILLPLSDHLDHSVHILSIHVAILASLVLLDTVGKVGATPHAKLSLEHATAPPETVTVVEEDRDQVAVQVQDQINQALPAETANIAEERQEPDKAKNDQVA